MTISKAPAEEMKTVDTAKKTELGWLIEKGLSVKDQIDAKAQELDKIKEKAAEMVKVEMDDGQVTRTEKTPKGDITITLNRDLKINHKGDDAEKVAKIKVILGTQANKYIQRKIDYKATGELKKLVLAGKLPPQLGRHRKLFDEVVSIKEGKDSVKFTPPMPTASQTR